MPKIGAAHDWGQLKQLIEDAELKKHQAEKEIGEAFKNAAENRREKNPKKWDAERDKLVAEWLMPSGIKWKSEVNAVTDPITTEDSSEIERIMTPGGLSKWEVFQLIKNGFKAAFLPLDEKNKLIREVDREIFRIVLEEMG